MLTLPKKSLRFSVPSSDESHVTRDGPGRHSQIVYNLGIDKSCFMWYNSNVRKRGKQYVDIMAFDILTLSPFNCLYSNARCIHKQVKL